MFADAEKRYNIWVDKLKNNKILSDQLINMRGNANEIIDCFSSCLNFGTAGARGIIGVGTNRINSVTVSHISSSYSDYLNKHFSCPSIVISYDTRKYSREFAKIASEVFSYNGITVHFFDEPSPIGLLSFAIRKLKCSGGVMITASHNPPEYNGYKIYNNNGAQPVNIDELVSILKNKDLFNFKRLDFNESLSCSKIRLIKSEIENEYIESVKKTFKIDSVEDIDITYSPLNGCSSKLFCKLFNNCKLNIVDEQNCHDESFKTCNPPDPQKEKSFSLALDLAKKNNSDLIILNDPDGDRLGIAIKFNDSYRILTALEIAVLFLNFIIETEKKQNICVIKSIVSCGICDDFIKFHKIRCIQTPPGFKYISQKIENIKKNSDNNIFIFGFEESNGFLMFNDVRDKDGISSSAFFCKMMSYYKDKKLNCVEILEQLYKKFGYITQENISIRETCREKIDKMIDKLKEHFILNKSEASKIIDYRRSEIVDLELEKTTHIELERTNILEIDFYNKSKLFVRASGTEPLIKFYFIYNKQSDNLLIDKVKKIVLHLICGK